MTAFFFDTEPVNIRGMDLEMLKQAALQSPLRRARYCLHKSEDDPIQEMVIAFCRDSIIPIHRHAQGSESYHIIEGELEVTLYDCEGRETSSLRMGPPNSGLPFMNRISTTVWHNARILTEFAVVHEVLRGPFDKNAATTLKAPSPS